MAEKDFVIVSTATRSAVRFLDGIEFVPLSKADTFSSQERAEATLEAYPFDRDDERHLRLQGDWLCMEKADAAKLLLRLVSEERFRQGFYGAADDVHSS